MYSYVLPLMPVRATLICHAYRASAGAIPTEIGRLARLAVLRLSDNQLSGAFPEKRLLARQTLTV